MAGQPRERMMVKKIVAYSPGVGWVQGVILPEGEDFRASLHFGIPLSGSGFTGYNTINNM